MEFLRKIRERARPVTIRMLAVGLVVYFGYHFVEGDRGLLAWMQLEGKLAKAESRATVLHMKRQRLEQRIALIRSRHIDEDMLDEQVRRMLNLIRPNEIVIYDGSGKTKSRAGK